MNGPSLLPLLVPTLLLGGCIEYFAEPPDLGPLPPPLDGGMVDGPLIEDIGSADGPPIEDAAPDAPPSEDAAPDGPPIEDAAPDGPLLEDAAPDGPLLEDAAPDGPLLEDAAPDGPLLEDAAPDACVVAPEACDGEDNDCDGEVDEEGPSLCPTPELNAETAQRLCVDGACALRCVAGNHDVDGEYETGCEYACRASNGGVEQCDGRDNDCDGITDEELAPPPANRQAGVCAGAVRVCVGQWVEPAYGERPGYQEPEVSCDGQDNDCDGAIDEDVIPPPADRQAGVCAGAVRVCAGVEQWVEPAYGERPGYEEPEVACDGQDNDCDGRTDEGIVEACDGQDNDCDGAIDEDVIPPPADRQAGVCAGAMRVCAGVEGWVEPVYGERPGYEEPEVSCDGRDNECDGQVDEGLVDCCGSDDLGPPCNGCTGVTVPAAGWVCIPPGEFMMGSPEGEEGRLDDEGPQRRVTLSRPLLMQTTGVTQAAWQAVARNNPSWYREGGRGGACDADAPGECPVEYVNWFEAAWYANALSEAEGLLPCYRLEGCNANPAGEDRECEDPPLVDVHCAGYRLPTEAEWEYATRAGTVTRFWSGDADADLARVGWYSGNSGRRPHRVAQKAANPWGLYDVHGNVWEWVSDWYGPYDPAELRDPTGPPDGVDRVARGGSAWNDARSARSASRNGGTPDFRYLSIGFRLARRPPSTGNPDP